MNLHSISRLVLIFLFSCLGSSGVQADDPLEKLPAYWKSNFDKEPNADSRQSRFVGYLEGSLDVKVPWWWQNEGIPMFSNRKASESAAVYGSHSQDSLKVNGDTITLEKDKRNLTTFYVRRESNNKEIWKVTVDEVAFPVFGRITRDFAVRVSGDTIYIFGRETTIRFIVALSMTDGKRLGYFAYLRDDIQNIDIR